MPTHTSRAGFDPRRPTTTTGNRAANDRRTARAIGALFLAAFVFYGVGSSLTLSATPSWQLYLGVAMMLVNSVVVVGIGILARGVLLQRAPAAGNAYLVTRVIEGALLGAGAVALLLAAPDANGLLYNLGMIVLAAGSLIFCVALWRHRLVPKYVAIWGFLGYAAFGTGCTLELAGVQGAGLYGAAPGGLFEVFFALFLIFKGFGFGGTGAMAAPATTSP